jgi:3-hydroxybutyryl-CoA dehydrogenase
MCAHVGSQALSRISHTVDMAAAVREADIISEAIVELIEVKREVLKTISTLCRSEAIISTNTMSLSISDIAQECRNPER